MRAIIHHQFGEPAEVLTVEEVATPEPGAGEVRVRTVLSPIHNHDLWTIRGTYGFTPELPARAGTEALGVVDALGEGVDTLTIGQRVVTGATFGAWAEYFIAKAGALIPVSDAIPDDAAAQLVSMPFSAISLLESLDLAEGDWLVQNAANGAVGRLVAQLAVARGINVVGLVRRRAGVDELAAQGIENVVATDTDGWIERVRSIVGHAPIRVGVDSLGGDASGKMLSLLGKDGALVVFGSMLSPVLNLGAGDVIFNGVTVKGFWASRVGAEMAPAQRAALLSELVARISDGVLTLPVEATYSFEDAAAASTANAAPGRAGKILLRP